jgi:hypothetical protein
MGQGVGEAVGQGGGLMHPAPPRWVETIVGLTIPPACRETVLGDLHERYAGLPQYLLDALGAVPLVIVSRIRRTTDAQVLLLEAFVLCLSFLAAARYRDANFLIEPWGLMRLAIPAAIALVAIMIEDAYARPGRRSPVKAIVGPAFGIAIAFLSQFVFSLGWPALVLPQWILLTGGGMGFLLVAALRMLFPPLADRPQGANGPAFWLEQSGKPMNIPPGAIRLVKGVGMIAVLAALATAGSPRLLVLAGVLLLAYEVYRRV